MHRLTMPSQHSLDRLRHLSCALCWSLVASAALASSGGAGDGAPSPSPPQYSPHGRPPGSPPPAYRAIWIDGWATSCASKGFPVRHPPDYAALGFEANDANGSRTGNAGGILYSTSSASPPLTPRPPMA